MQGNIDLNSLDKLTDRELGGHIKELNKKLYAVKEEKEKRRRGNRLNDSYSYNSSGHLINFMRPYNPS